MATPTTLDATVPEHGQRAALAALGAVVVIWGLGPPLSKEISAPGLTVAAVRMWVAVPFMAVMQRVGGSRLSWRAIAAARWGGLAFGVNMAFFFTAIQHASVATVTLISSLQPVAVMLGAIRFFGERPTRWRLGWTAAGIASVALAVAGAGAAVRATPLGITLSVGAVISLSTYLLVSRRARGTLASAEYLTGVMVWAAITVTPIALWQGLALADLDGADWFWIVVVLVGPGWLGHLLMNWAITSLPLGITALNMLPATVISIAVAWPLHGEPVTAVQAVAGVATLISVALVVHGPLRRSHPTSATGTTR